MRIASCILIIFGILGAAVSFLAYSGAALPYQDPTPEMLEQQAIQIRFWGMSILINLSALVIGILGLRRSRRRKRDE